MEFTKLILAHFSPTGGTKKVADAIASGFDLPLTEVDLTAPTCPPVTEEQDLLLAVLPVFAGRVPKIALERLTAVVGSCRRAVAVVVYGNREFDDALLETKNTLEACGCRVIATGAFIAEHSIVRSVAAARPDAQDEALARDFAGKILARTEASPSLQVPGVLPYREHPPASAHPSANESCIRCGLCAKGCPTGAIDEEAPQSCKGELCINCMRCVQACPLHCRTMPAPFMAWITQMLQETASGYKTPEFFL